MAKPREENAVERINRINYEFRVNKERPKHLDDKNIYSFEERFEKNSKNINNKKIAKKPKPKPKPTFPQSANEFMDLSDWLEIIDPGGWASDDDKPMKKSQVEENLFEKYLELLNSGQLAPGVSFQQFEKDFFKFDTDVFTEIKKRANKKKRVEGLAALLGVSPGRT